MVSFAQLWEQIEMNKNRPSPLMTSGEEERSLSVVRMGKDMHEDDEVSFWDEFISLCGNSEGLSQLLGVSREKILSWPARIQEMLDKLEKHTAEDPSQKNNKEVIPTGETGAITVNGDPNLNDLV